MSRKIIKPSQEQLLFLLNEEKLSPKQIAEKLGYKDVSNVYHYLRLYNIKVDFSPNHDLRSVDFTSTQKSFVLGTLLGDGSLRVNRQAGVSLVVSHSTKQAEYLNWKKDILSNFIVSDKPYERDCHIAGYNTKTVTYCTITHPYLKELRNSMYINGVKTVTLEYLNQIDLLSLATWFCDDGSLNSRYGFMVLCTQSFSYDEHLLMQQWFSEKYGLHPIIENRVSTVNKKHQYVLRFNTNCAKSLRKLISPYTPQCMSYKVTY